ncbi:MAG: carboxylating nicotinate-nucleotide diphosphorylase [Ignavibacteriales bacterium]|nr:carboxylating nicotinate-nucleotide diphosphorylase [Ignavibacteriales bacterium]
MTDAIIQQAVVTALTEDLGNEDITTNAIFALSDMAEGFFWAKADGIVAGLEVAGAVFRHLDRNIVFEPLTADGSKVEKGTRIATIKGPAGEILAGERTALNFLQRMSGIATATGIYTALVAGTGTKILDTRKTVPGLRLLDKLAVRLGGGENHRIGLYDMFLIKDNHIQVAGSLSEAVKRCIAYRDEKYPGYKIEVETESFEQIQEALQFPVDIIMLDNFSPDEIVKAVALINGRAKTEASGGITLDTVRAYAEAGVDYISIGALTHSVKALDISLELNV